MAKGCFVQLSPLCVDVRTNRVFRNLQHKAEQKAANALRDSIINDMNAAILDPQQQEAVNQLLEQLEEGLPTNPLTAAQSAVSA